MKKKILIIDDEADLVALLEHIFSSTGLYDVVTACDGLQGKQKAIEEKPDIIFLDYIMPEVMGDDVLKFIRSQPELNRTEVVIMTGLAGSGYFNTGSDQTCVESDCDTVPESLLGDASSVGFPHEMISQYRVIAILPKPFSCEKLLGITARILSNAAENDVV